MMKFDKKTVGVWFLVTTEKQDWLATLSEVEPNAKYELTYRFRYYSPESVDPWDGKDRKSWYSGVVNGTREAAITGLREVGNALVLFGAIGHLDEVLNEGDFEDFIRRFRARPWVFSREEEPDDEKDKDFMASLDADDGKKVQ
jgi:hypothetical protein